MSGRRLTPIIIGMRIPNILKQLAGPTQSLPAGAHVTIRHAHPADADALAVLAQLDSSHPPRGAILVAEAGGELWAAVSLDDNHLIANPFQPSGELAFHLNERARELRRAERRQTRRAARRISLAT
jgi:hypothetical protein